MMRRKSRTNLRRKRTKKRARIRTRGDMNGILGKPAGSDDV